MPSGIYKHKPQQGFQKGHKPYGSFVKGSKHTEESKRKMSQGMKGRIPWDKGGKRPEMTGENSPVWVFGNYKKQGQRNDSAYQNWAKKVKKRDNNQCVFKGQNCFGYNIVHHILPWRDFPELRYNIKNGITLCQFHHPRKRVEEQRLIPFFQEMVGSKELI